MRCNVFSSVIVLNVLYMSSSVTYCTIVFVGNRITSVSSLSSLASLTELNLRRNFIERVSGIERLPMLQRVFLSHNLISALGDVDCLFQVRFLIELSLDGNPVSNKDAIAYRNAVILVSNSTIIS